MALYDPFAKMLDEEEPGVMPTGQPRNVSAPSSSSPAYDPFASMLKEENSNKGVLGSPSGPQTAPAKAQSEGVLGGIGNGVLDFGKGIAHGAAVAVPQMVGQAMQRYDDKGGNDMVRDAGKSIEAFGNENDAAFPSLQESQASKQAREDSAWNPRGWGYSAGESLATSVAPVATVAAGAAAVGASPFIAGAAGIGAVGALFYGSTAEDTYRRAKKAGLSDEDATTVSRITGGIEAVGEMIADIIPLRLMKVGSKPLKDKLIKSILTKTGAKDAMKGLLNTMFSEVATETAQQGGEAYAEKAYGVRDADVLGEMADVIGPTLIVSTIFHGAGVGAHNMRVKSMEKALSDPKADPKAKAQAIATVAHEVNKVDPKLAKKFVKRASFLQSQGKPIILSEDSEYRKQLLGQNLGKFKSPDSENDVDILGGAETGTGEENAGQLGDTIPTSPQWQAIIDSENLPPQTPSVPISQETLARGNGITGQDSTAPLDNPIAGGEPISPEMLAKGNEAIDKQAIPGTVAETTQPAMPEGINPIDVAANEAATSIANDKPLPSAKDAASGKYEKGEFDLHGMKFKIENPAGSVRKGKDEGGKPWEQELKNHYGEIEGFKGADGDNLDVFFGNETPTEDSTVYVVDQYKADGKTFDEHKVVLGAASEEDALAIYNQNYQPGWTGGKAVTPMSMEEFKAWGEAGGGEQGALKPEEGGSSYPIPDSIKAIDSIDTLTAEPVAINTKDRKVYRASKEQATEAIEKTLGGQKGHERRLYRAIFADDIESFGNGLFLKPNADKTHEVDGVGIVASWWTTDAQNARDIALDKAKNAEGRTVQIVSLAESELPEEVYLQNTTAAGSLERAWIGIPEDIAKDKLSIHQLPTSNNSAMIKTKEATNETSGNSVPGRGPRQDNVDGGKGNQLPVLQDGERSGKGAERPVVSRTDTGSSSSADARPEGDTALQKGHGGELSVGDTFDYDGIESRLEIDKDGYHAVDVATEAVETWKTPEEFTAATGLTIAGVSGNKSVTRNTVSSDNSVTPTLTHEGRRTDGKPILPGDVFSTSSGRKTTPYPKYSRKRTTKPETKKLNQWLIGNYIAEAQARGDNFNLTLAKGLDAGNFSQADSDSINAYLFGEQPAVPKPMLKPLVTPKPADLPSVDTVTEPATVPASDNLILTKAGKPFKTKKSASFTLGSKKLSATHEVVEVKGGFALQEKQGLKPISRLRLKKTGKKRGGYPIYTATHIDESVRSTLMQMRQEISEAQAGKVIAIEGGNGMGGTNESIGSPSTFPGYFQDKGYTKEKALDAIDEYLSGKGVTSNRDGTGGKLGMLIDLFEAKRQSVAKQARDYRNAKKVREEIAAVDPAIASLLSDATLEGMSEDAAAAVLAVAGDIDFLNERSAQGEIEDARGQEKIRGQEDVRKTATRPAEEGQSSSDGDKAGPGETAAPRVEKLDTGEDQYVLVDGKTKPLEFGKTPTNPERANATTGDLMDGMTGLEPTLFDKQTPTEPQSDYGKNNKVFTKDAADAALAKLMNTNKLSSNPLLDPELMQAGITLAGYHIEAGARKFADYVVTMKDKLGDSFDQFKPHLKSWYVAIKADPAASGWELDGYDSVDKADVDYHIYQADKSNKGDGQGTITPADIPKLVSRMIDEDVNNAFIELAAIAKSNPDLQQPIRDELGDIVGFISEDEVTNEKAKFWFKHYKRVASREAKIEEARTAAGGKIIGAQLQRTQHNGSVQYATILPDASDPGRFRVSYYDERGFSGHDVFDTEEDALRDVAIAGYTEKAEKDISTLVGTDLWKQGMEHVLKIQRGLTPGTEAWDNFGKETNNPSPDKIDDFGEVLHGARKHYTETLRDAASLDSATVPLSKSWPEPKHNDLIEKGVDPYLVGVVRAMRDIVPTKGRSKWRLRDYVDKLELARGISIKILSGEINKSEFTALLNEEKYKGLRNQLTNSADLYVAIGHENSLKGIRVNVGSYSAFDGKEYNPPKTIWSVEKKGTSGTLSRWPRQLATGGTKEEAIANFKAKAPEYFGQQKAKRKGTTFSIYTKAREKGKNVFIGKRFSARRYTDLESFNSVKEARKYLAQNQDKLEEKFAKIKDIPSERKAENAPRVGDDHLQGRDVTPEIFAETFGFRGVQFGNYVEQKKRQNDMNEAYEALMDMAGILDISPKAISLNGELGLAFGARGRGGKGAAAAHYEPDTVVINLTKNSGAGSLAHEWWHSLDNYFNRRRDAKDYMSEEPHKRNRFDGGKLIEDPTRAEMIDAFKRVMAEINGTEMPQRSAALDGTKSKPYWGTQREMAARAFENYIISKLHDNNAANDYLANILSEEDWKSTGYDMVAGTKTFPYLTEDENLKVRDAFQNLFDTVDEQETSAGIALFSRYNENDEKIYGNSGTLARESLSAGRDGKLRAHPITQEEAYALQDEGAGHLVARVAGYDTPGTKEWYLANTDETYRQVRPYDGGQIRFALSEQARNLIGKLTSSNDSVLLESVMIGERPVLVNPEHFDPAHPEHRFSRKDIAKENAKLTRDVEALRQRKEHLIAKFGNLTRKWANRPSISVVESEDQLPTSLQDDIRNQQAGGQVHAVFHEGKIYVVAENVKTDDAAESAIFHEAIGHYGMRKLFGREFGSAINSLKLALGGRSGIMKKAEEWGINLEDYEKGITKALTRKNQTDAEIKAMHEKIDNILVDELLAHMAGNNIKPTAVQRVVQSIRNALKRLGFTFKLTDGDLIDLVSKARHAVVKGKSGAVYAGGTRFAAAWHGNNDNAVADDNSDTRFSLGSRIEQAKTYAAEQTEAFRRKFQDEYLELKRTQERIAKAGGVLNEDTAPYRVEELHTSKAQYQLDQFEDTLVSPLMAEIKASDVSVKELEDYLYARHSFERNAYIQSINPEFGEGGSGMTDQEAQDILDGFDQAGKTAELKRLAAMTDKITTYQRKLIRDAGLETEEVLDAWERYKHYVPLKGTADEETTGGGMHNGRGFGVRKSGTQQALGRASRATDILANIFAQTGSTIQRVEKAKVSQAFLKMVEENPDENAWTVHKAGEDNWPTRRALVNGVVKNYPDPSMINSSNVIPVTRDGELYYVKIKNDQLAAAMNRLNVPETNTVLRKLGVLNRYLSMVNTMFNPEFMVTNFERDITTAMINLTGEQSGKMAKKVFKQVPSAMRGIRNALRGDNSHEMAGWYDRFRKAGGNIGFMDLQSVEERQKQIVALAGESNGSLAQAKKYIKAAGDIIGDYNTVIENAVRLSTFKTAIESGMSESAAASLAKNLTVNFNRKGELGTAMNSMYLFFNAGVQGSTRIIQALKHKKVRKIAWGIVGLSVAMAEMNRASGGDDDDDRAKWDKVSDYLKATNLMLMKEDGSLIKFKMPYGFSVFVALGNALSDAGHYVTSRGKDGKSPAAATANMMSALLNSFNPLGGDEGLLNTLSPTITDPFVDVALNRNFMGAPIKPQNSPYGPQKPQSQLYWSNVRPSSKWIAAKLNSLTGGDQVETGGVDVSPETLDHFFDFFTGGAGRFVGDVGGSLVAAVKGEELPTSRIPFVRQVIQDKNKYIDLKDYRANSDLVKGHTAVFRDLRGRARNEYRKEHPEVKLREVVKVFDRRMKHLKKSERRFEESGNNDRVKELRTRIRREAMRFNKRFWEVTQ